MNLASIYNDVAHVDAGHGATDLELVGVHSGLVVRDVLQKKTETCKMCKLLVDEP